MSLRVEENEFRVLVRHTSETKRVVSEVWMAGDETIERLGGFPAIREFCPKTGNLVAEEYYERGKLHREGDLAARKLIDPETGVIVQEVWAENGLRHRSNDQPSTILRDRITGHLIEIRFTKRGKLHREGGPAVEYFEGQTGRRYSAEYWREGQQVVKPDLSFPEGPT